MLFRLNELWLSAWGNGLRVFSSHMLLCLMHCITCVLERSNRESMQLLWADIWPTYTNSNPEVFLYIQCLAWLKCFMPILSKRKRISSSHPGIIPPGLWVIQRDICQQWLLANFELAAKAFWLILATYLAIPTRACYMTTFVLLLLGGSISARCT